jgi:hypothetical protein
VNAWLRTASSSWARVWARVEAHESRFICGRPCLWVCAWLHMRYIRCAGAVSDTYAAGTFGTRVSRCCRSRSVTAQSFNCCTYPPVHLLEARMHRTTTTYTETHAQICTHNNNADVSLAQSVHKRAHPCAASRDGRMQICESQRHHGAAGVDRQLQATERPVRR